MANLILLSGLPASGKSSFGEFLEKKLHFPLFAKDTIKEILFDHVGFSSHAEKVRLDIASVEIMYYGALKLLWANTSVILDNNFENRNIPSLEALLAACQCNVITVLFHGDTTVLYQRFLDRDEDPNRHPGHVSNTCYPNPTEPEGVLDLHTFETKFFERGAMDFAVGSVIRVDTTDFSTVSYPEICAQVERLLV